MSADDLDIRHGGVLVVDTDTLRAVMRRLERMAARVAEASEQLASAMSRAGDDVRWNSAGVPTLVREGAEVAEASRAMASDLGQMAEVYEYIELSAMADLALRSSDAPAWAGYREQMQEMREHAGGVGFAAWAAKAERGLTWNGDFSMQALGGASEFNPLLGWNMGAAAALLTGTIGIAGRGTVGREERLAGPMQPVVVRPVAASTGPAVAHPASAHAAFAQPASPATAPAGLAAALSRIPQGEAQVRVETYTMANGSKQYAVYIAGTRASSFGASDPFDSTSNVQLYSGQRSASYEAVREALYQSGAARGDTVHVFGHSQGAMIGGRVALENEFEVKTLGTAGPPIEADVPDTTLSIALRHTDDPVAMLSGGGTAHGPGSADSIIVERLADPEVGLHDVELGVAHGLDVYIETAEMVDASNDPRIESVRAVFDGLDQAVSVEVTEFVAERPDRPDAGGEE